MLVLDSVGVGALPDAASYGDEGSNTLGNTAAAVGGLSHAEPRAHGARQHHASSWACRPSSTPTASWGRNAEESRGQGHHHRPLGDDGPAARRAPFPTYPDGFPPEVMDAFTRETGLGWLGNYPASGTVIIQELGDEHVAHRQADRLHAAPTRVFQIAAHEDVIPIERLYEICAIARDQRAGRRARGRARSSRGRSSGPTTTGTYTRTHRRRDFALEPFEPTVLDRLAEAGILSYGIGKIGEIFAWRGICESPHSTDNMDGFDNLRRAGRDDDDSGFVFANLVDFDMVWGHRNDVEGYARGLEAVDARMPELLDAMVDGRPAHHHRRPRLRPDHATRPTTAASTRR